MAPSRIFSTRTSLLLMAAFFSLASAQQGVLTSGNTQLPACAQQCPAMMSAAAACSGTTSATTAVWNCFCQSAYLKGLYTSPTGVCDTTTCTAAADNQSLMNWYKSNCGTDNGAKEHANAAAPSGTAMTTTTAPASASTSAALTSSNSALPSTGVTNTGSTNAGAASNSQKPWIDTHYQWIIFVVVVIVGFAIITVLAVWYKRRYYRKRDQINGGFNAGVSDQAPPMSNAAYNNSGNMPAPSGAGSPSLPARDGARLA